MAFEVGQNSSSCWSSFSKANRLQQHWSSWFFKLQNAALLHLLKHWCQEILIGNHWPEKNYPDIKVKIFESRKIYWEKQTTSQQSPSGLIASLYEELPFTTLTPPSLPPHKGKKAFAVPQSSACKLYRHPRELPGQWEQHVCGCVSQVPEASMAPWHCSRSPYCMLRPKVMPGWHCWASALGSFFSKGLNVKHTPQRKGKSCIAYKTHLFVFRETPHHPSSVWGVLEEAWCGIDAPHLQQYWKRRFCKFNSE